MFGLNEYDDDMIIEENVFKYVDVKCCPLLVVTEAIDDKYVTCNSIGLNNEDKCSAWYSTLLIVALVNLLSLFVIIYKP
jgi:hypothetical protein